MDNVFLVLGEIFSGLSAICLGYSTFSKDKNKLISWQVADSILVTISDIFLGGYAAACINLIGVARNVLQVKKRYSLTLMIIVALAMLGLGIMTNNRGHIGVFAIMAGVSYSVFMYVCKTAQGMRWALLFNTICWLMHDILIKSYPLVIMGVVILILTVYNLFRLGKKHKRKNGTL